MKAYPLVLTGLIAACSGDAVTQLCSDAEQCSLLSAQNASECSQVSDTCINTLKSGDQACQTLANATESLASCATSIPCTQWDDIKQGLQCAQEASAFSSAYTAALTAGCPKCNISVTLTASP